MTCYVETLQQTVVNGVITNRTSIDIHITWGELTLLFWLGKPSISGRGLNLVKTGLYCGEADILSTLRLDKVGGNEVISTYLSIRMYLEKLYLLFLLI